MNIFGFSVPLWIVLTAIFGVIYITFSILSALRVRKLKRKREEKYVTHNS